MAAAEGTSGETIANGCSAEFEDWLSSRMRQLGLDEDVFGSYVTGVLDSEDTDEERKDALIGILEGMTVWRDVCTREKHNNIDLGLKNASRRLKELKIMKKHDSLVVEGSTAVLSNFYSSKLYKLHIMHLSMLSPRVGGGGGGGLPTGN